MSTIPLDRGEHTLKLSTAMFAENRRRLVDELKRQGKLHDDDKAAVCLMGGRDSPGRYATDTEPTPFRQESNFFWAFGVMDPDCYGFVLADGRAMVFVPQKDDAYRVWSGP